jgi:hypothetical protein
MRLADIKNGTIRPLTTEKKGKNDIQCGTTPPYLFHPSISPIPLQSRGPAHA